MFANTQSSNQAPCLPVCAFNHGINTEKKESRLIHSSNTRSCNEFSVLGNGACEHGFLIIRSLLIVRMHVKKKVYRYFDEYLGTFVN